MPMCRPASAMTRRELPSPAYEAWIRSLRRCIPSLGREEREQRRAAGVRLEAAAVAAPADRAVLVDRDVPDLTGLAVDAAEQVAADDESGADRVADADEDGRRSRAGAALARLGEACEVRLAVDEDRAADAGGQALGDVDAFPAAQQPGGRHHAGARIDRGGQGESDGEQIADRAAERLHHVAQQDAEPIELGVVPVVEREGQRSSGSRPSGSRRRSRCAAGAS